jgi:hypothetical protein
MVSDSCADRPGAGRPGGEEGAASGWTDRPDQTRPPRGPDSPIGEIVERLESDPYQCWQALEGLAAVEEDVRLSIIEALAQHHGRRGVSSLLRLLCTTRDPASSWAARSSLGSAAGSAPGCDADGAAEVTTLAPCGIVSLPAHGDPAASESLTAGATPDRVSLRPGRSLVTPIDGGGRASILVSCSVMAQRRTAAFLCDVRQGICDVVGEVDRDVPHPAGLLEELIQQWGRDCVCDVPELALGLLAGTLMLRDTPVAPPVRDWLDGTLGPEFRGAPFPAEIPDLDTTPIPDDEMPGRAHAVIDACPSWLDSSPLLFELAEEISLREAGPVVDPERDAGAYRFLFEHRLVRRLEMYRRMLLWMAWLWRFSGEVELARSALTLARQLSDEQYAVPSNPFTRVLTSRSIEAAQARLRTEADPRGRRDGA